MNEKIKMNRVNLFLLLTFAINWTIAGLFYLLFPGKEQVPYTIMAILYMFIPAIVVIIIDKLIDKRKGFKSLAINFKLNRWYLAAWIGVVLVAFILVGVSLLWPGISYSPDMSGYFERLSTQLGGEDIDKLKAQMAMMPIPYWIIAIIQTLIAGVSVNALAGFGEELGWRGFLVREYKNLKFWDASLRIGIIWGIWHAPLIMMGHNYPQHPMLGVGFMVIFCLLISPLILYIRMKTHSVIGAAIMHGTMNGSAGIPILFISGGNDLTIGFTGITGFIVLSLVIVITIIYDLKFAPVSITNKTLLEGANIDSIRNSAEKDNNSF